MHCIKGKSLTSWLCVSIIPTSNMMHLKMQVSAAHLAGGFLLLQLLLHCSTLVSCQAPPPPPSPATYDYSNGPNGPANWGNTPGWELCSSGTQQSPINLIKDEKLLFNPLNVVYKSQPVDAEIYNDGLTPTINVLDQNAGILTISGVTYVLENIHFHTPREHTIRFITEQLMEQHLVHMSADGKVAVIALLYIRGAENTFLAQFFGDLPIYTTPNVRRPIRIKLPSLKHASYFRYNGSLTTPPCDEGVTWTILNHFPTMSSTQLLQLEASKPGNNARPLQAKNGRIVSLVFK